MMSLLKKDVFLSKDKFVTLNLLWILYSFVAFNFDMFIALAFIITLGMPFGLMAADTFQKTDITICSLPVRRKQVVLARYIFILLYILYGVLVSLVLGLAISSFLPMSDSGFELFRTFTGITGFTLMSVFLISIYLPFYFRYGLIGSFKRIVLILAALFAALVLEEQFPFGLTGFIRGGVSYFDPVVLKTAAPVIVLGTLIISIKLSKRFYNNFDL